MKQKLVPDNTAIIYVSSKRVWRKKDINNNPMEREKAKRNRNVKEEINTDNNSLFTK